MTDEVLVSVEGGIGRLRLNRPKAIHALTHDMCVEMGNALLAWRDNPTVIAVLIDHAEGRGFCAGGDIRAIWDSGRTDGTEAAAFFHEEYRLNHLLFTYPKPVIAIMDGITMGGGVGISQPASIRIATERTVYAMPETGIGLFPDVGGGWYLSRLPDRVGQYLAATGARIDGADCLALGLATHFVPSADIEALKAVILSAPDRAASLVTAAAKPAPPSKLDERRADIARLFASDAITDIEAALAAEDSEFAQATLATLGTKSPQTIKVSLRLLAESLERDDFAEEMRSEYRIATRVCRMNDFLEGVRALIVDKTNDPHWDPPTTAAVPDSLLDAVFAPLPSDAEWTPYPISVEEPHG